MPLFKRDKEDDLDDFFKAKDLKIYSDTNSLNEDKRFYRTVFDESEINYLNFELTLFNKKFDEEDWDTKANFTCHLLVNGLKDREMCNIDLNVNVSKETNILFIREGWGMADKGSYWHGGAYQIEASIEGKVVSTKFFYIESEGVINSNRNPYFELLHIKAYNAEGKLPARDSIKYLKQFSAEKTQYIWFEYKIKNILGTSWNFEIFINIYDKSGLLKAGLTNFYTVPTGKKDWEFTFDSGWGNENTGSWKPGQYIAQFVAMGSVIASVPFTVASDEVEGDLEYSKNISDFASSMTSAATQNANLNTQLSVEDSLKSIDELIGLSNVKNEINEQIKYLQFAQIRKEKGIDENTKINLHSVFTGNPGTGKTTVVNLLGKVYQAMGLLSKGHVVEVDRADLCGEFIGQTAPKVKKNIEAARGGVLFIDEAYSLARKGANDGKDYGLEVIEILLKEMSDGDGDLAIMVAGYPDEMNYFLNSNPGLKSRFGQYFHFEDYMPDELMQIASLTAQKINVTVSENASKVLEKKLVEHYRNRDKNFGNARLVTSVISEAKQNMAVRQMQNPNVKNFTKEELSTIEAQDILDAFGDDISKKLKLAVDEELLRTALAELNELTGLQNIKNEVSELTKLVKYYRDIGRDVLNKFSLHAIFLGNPGTGKTTVARIMAKIYKALGLLERGHLVEVDREQLVAGYVGQTALKTKEILEKSIGGVLFIDEAYSLVGSNTGSDTGSEAVETILKFMEDNRGKFAVIAAGYTNEMIEFLESNPGLKSRFDKNYVFVDYTADELYTIALGLLSNESLTPDADAEAHLKNHLNFLLNNGDKHFGNAREVRKIIEKAIRNQNLRMASIEKANRTESMILTLTIDDVKEFTNEKLLQKRGIGFN